MAVKTLYAIISANGQLKARYRTKTGVGSLFTDKNQAIRQALDDGDSVVPIVYDTSLQPVFIRLKKLDPAKDPAETDGYG